MITRVRGKKTSKTVRPRVQWTFSLRLRGWFWIVWALLVIVLASWSWFGKNGFLTALSLRQQREALEQENRSLRARNARVLEEIRLFQRDSRFTEWILRDRLGMLGEGERLYVFQD